MVIVAISSFSEGNAHAYLEVLRKATVDLRLFTPGVSLRSSSALQGVGGLLIAGDPEEGWDEGSPTSPSLKVQGLDLLGWALKQDMPVLAIGSGMALVNEVLGGGSPQVLTSQHVDDEDGSLEFSHHSIYISPGSKLAAIIGMGGFFKVNSRHRRGLKDAQRSPRLLASAYSLLDGVIEGLESPEHSWIIGIQASIEHQEEVPKAFKNVFTAFLERAERYGAEKVPDS